MTQNENPETAKVKNTDLSDARVYASVAMPPHLHGRTLEFSDQRKSHATSPAILGSALVGGAIAGLGTEYALSSRMLAFDRKLADATMQDVKSMGLSGGLAANGAVMTDGSAIAGGIVKESNYLRMLLEPENRLPRILHNLGGRSTFSLLAGVAGAALAGGIAYAATKPKQELHTRKILQERIVNSEQQESPGR